MAKMRYDRPWAYSLRRRAGGAGGARAGGQRVVVVEEVEEVAAVRAGLISCWLVVVRRAGRPGILKFGCVVDHRPWRAWCGQPRRGAAGRGRAGGAPRVGPLHPRPSKKQMVGLPSRVVRSEVGGERGDVGLAHQHAVEAVRDAEREPVRVVARRLLDGVLRREGGGGGERRRRRWRSGDGGGSPSHLQREHPIRAEQPVVLEHEEHLRRRLEL